MNADLPIMVIGVKGQLGHDCQEVLANDYPVIGVDLPEVDITDRDRVVSEVERHRPRAIINCAAWTRVDDAETRAEEARLVNAVGAANVAAAAATAGARLIHISTDYVFDGRRRPQDGGYRESDPVSPQSVYGRTKLAGEQAVTTGCPDALVVRTAWLYGRHGANFPKTMLRLALSQPDRPLRVVDDQYGSPTWSRGLANQLALLLTTDLTGIVHASAEGTTTWCGFARRFLETMNVAHHIEPCSTADYPTPALRPAFAALENQRLKTAGLNIMRDWRTDVDQFVQLFREELMAEIR